MTERQVQRAFMLRRGKTGHWLPNYTPANWWECDLFHLTESCYFREFEIKLTVSDFRADAKKYQRHGGDWIDGKWKSKDEHKHAMLKSGDVRGPTQFHFVAPAGLLPLTEIPRWAGLIEFTDHRNYSPPWNLHFVEIKRAPRLHKTKADPKRLEIILRTSYYRFNSLFIYGKFPDSEQPELPDAETLATGADHP